MPTVSARTADFYYLLVIGMLTEIGGKCVL